MFSESIENTVTELQNNKRLDQVLAEVYPDYSRSKLKQWLESGYVSLNGEDNCKARHKVKTGDKLILNQKKLENEGLALEQNQALVPEDIPLDIVYEDQDIIVINKPNNLVVHPGAGNYKGTLVNALLYHYPELSRLPRAGIVHRLDKNTTGLMVVARNELSHFSLIKQLQERSVSRKYIALVNGNLISGGTIDINIGRHKNNRIKMAVFEDDDEEQYSKSAITHYRVLEKFNKHTLIEAKLETGRTHQIRVHMAHMGYSLVGDSLYGRNYAVLKEFNVEQSETWSSFRRQALCAVELGFEHPTTNEYVQYSIEPPSDMLEIIDILRQTNNVFKVR